MILRNISSTVLRGWDLLTHQVVSLGGKIGYLCSSLKQLALKVSQCFWDCFSCCRRPENPRVPLQESRIQVNEPSLEEQLEQKLIELEKTLVSWNENTQPSIEQIANLRKQKREIKSLLQHVHNSREQVSRYQAVKHQVKQFAQRREPFKTVLACKADCQRVKSSDSFLLKRYAQRHNLSNESLVSIPEAGKLPDAVKQRLRQLEDKMVGLASPQETILAAFDQMTYAHATTSAIFGLLDRSNHCLLATEDLLKQGVAPMSGELYQGGMATFSLETQGHTAAIRLDQDDAYSFSSIQKSYSQSFLFDAKHYALDLNDLNQSLDQFSCLDFHIILLKLMRAKQWGEDSLFAEGSLEIRHQINGKLSERVNDDLQLLENVFFLIDHLSLNDQTDAFEDRLALMNQIDVLKCNRDLHRPIDQNQLKERFSQHLNESIPSALLSPVNTLELENLSTLYHAEVLHKRGDFSKFIVQALQLKRRSNFNWQEWSQPLREEFQCYKDKAGQYLKMCQDVLTGEAAASIDEKAKTYFRTARPIVLFSQNAAAFHRHGMEYRSVQPLRFGKDISLIGVEEEETQNLVESYLQTHRIEGVSVVKTDLIRRCTLNY